MEEMASPRAPSSLLPSTSQTSRRGRRCGGGWQIRRRGSSTVIVATLAAVTVMVACLAAATRGSPTRALVDGGNGGGVNEVALPRSWTQLPSLAGLTSRAGAGPCSTSACIGRWKGGFIAALFVEGVIGGLAPQALQFLSPAWRSRSLHIANAFSGGIFFSTGMLHILPEAIEHIAGEGHGSGGHDEHEDEEHGDEEHDHEDEHEEGEHEDSHGFPTGYALAVAGFYAILFIEHLVLGKFTHAHGPTAPSLSKGQTSPVSVTSADHLTNGVAASTSEGLAAGVKASDADYTAVVEGGDEAAHANAAVGGALQRGERSISTRSVESIGSDSSYARKSRLEAENVGFFSANFGRAFLAAFSVGIHVVFESLSLGLASSWSTLLNTFLAIAAHRWATAASLGVKFEKERLRRLQSIVLIVLWSAVTPAAAGIGAAIDGGVSDEVAGVLLALSAGTFLYIGAFEVNSEEFIEHTRDRWAKAAAVILGAGIIMAVTAILSETGVH